MDPAAGGAAVRALAELVRAPAALTVLGDTVAGSAAAGLPMRGRRLALPLASTAFYWAGMALNDWADRDVDAVERPERPIPSGRVRPGTALGVATALTAAGFGLSALGGGRSALRLAAPLAASIWLYDLVAKPTAAGPAAMALCRGLDVLLGGGRSALPAAAVVAGHTFGVTALSRGEVHGGSSRGAVAALAGTVVTTAGALRGTTGRRLAAGAFATAYLGTVGRAQRAAVRDPSAARVREATKAGIHGMVPLQAALTARGGSVAGAAALGALLPLARLLSRRVSPT